MLNYFENFKQKMCFMLIKLQGMVWNGRRFFHIPFWKFSSIPFPFHTKNLPFHFPFHTTIFFHIPFRSSIPFSIPYYNFLPYSIPYFHTKVSLDRKRRVICIAFLQRLAYSLLLPVIAQYGAIHLIPYLRHIAMTYHKNSLSIKISTIDVAKIFDRG